MISNQTDYSEERGTFKIISKKPLHIQLSSIVFNNDSKDVIDEIIKRDFVSNAYNTFIFTKENEIKITVVPLNESALKSKNKNQYIYLNQFKKTFVFKRDKSLFLLKNYLKISDFKNLIDSNNSPNNSFNKIIYNDQGYPTLNLMYKEITKK